MIEKKGTYCFVVYSAKDDLPVGCYDTYCEITDHLGISRPSIWRALRDHCLIYGQYYIDKVLL